MPGHRNRASGCSLRSGRQRRPSLLRRVAGAFCSNEAGNATIEFVIWVPAFSFLLMFFLDIGLYFATRAEMMRVTQEAARYISVGALQPEAAADYMKRAMLGEKYTVDVTTSPEITISTSIPTLEVTVFGIIDLLGRELIGVEAVVRREIYHEDIETGAV